MLAVQPLLGLAWFAATRDRGAPLACGLGAWATRPRRSSAGSLLGLRLLPARCPAFFVLAMFCRRTGGSSRPNSDETFGDRCSERPGGGWRCGCSAAALLRAARVLLAGHALTVVMRRLASPMRRRRLRSARLRRRLARRHSASAAIIIGSDALAALTPAELDVAISHEQAHQRSRDNLKRFLIYCAPDVFGWSPIARRPRGALASGIRVPGRRACRFAATIGRAVDAGVSAGQGRQASASGGDSRGAWRASGARRAAEVWSAFHVAALLETRVRRLVGGQTTVPRMRTWTWTWARCAVALVAGSLPLAAWTFDLTYARSRGHRSAGDHLP